VIAPLSLPSASADSRTPEAFIASERAAVAFSNTSRSCLAYPFTVSTRFGIRS
jgi:hypothetical protein